MLVSIADGHHCGSPFISNVYPLAAAHGSLRQSSATGFVMSMAGVVPDVTRMADLRKALQEIGLEFRD